MLPLQPPFSASAPPSAKNPTSSTATRRGRDDPDPRPATPAIPIRTTAENRFFQQFVSSLKELFSYKV